MCFLINLDASLLSTNSEGDWVSLIKWLGGNSGVVYRTKITVRIEIHTPTNP